MELTRDGEPSELLQEHSLYQTEGHRIVLITLCVAGRSFSSVLAWAARHKLHVTIFGYGCESQAPELTTMKKQKRILLNDMPNYNYKKANPSQERRRINRFVEGVLKSNGVYT